MLFAGFIINVLLCSTLINASTVNPGQSFCQCQLRQKSPTLQVNASPRPMLNSFQLDNSQSPDPISRQLPDQGKGIVMGTISQQYNIDQLSSSGSNDNAMLDNLNNINSGPKDTWWWVEGRPGGQWIL